jgi:hypothetical protein
MTRTSGTALIAALTMLAVAHASLAQNSTSAPPPGTNSAGAAQSSGGPALNTQPGVTTGSTGMGSGNAAPPPTANGNAAINDENKVIDSKVKGICRGC